MSKGWRGAVKSTAKALTRIGAEFAQRGRRFLLSRRGNTAIIFGLATIPILIGAGCAIDLSRALVVRQRLAHALDAAGLAIGRDSSLVTTEQMTQAAQDFFKANYPESELGVPSDVTVTLPVPDSTDVIQLSANARVDTAIMRIVGIDYLTVNVSNEVTRAQNGLELALVLDTTGSMGSPSWKMPALKSSATNLVNTLFGPNDSPIVKIGVVPFAEAVRLDPDTAVNNGWIDTLGQSSTAQLNFTGGKHPYWLYTNPGGLVDTPWLGCVEARPNGLEETDTPPSAGDPDTLWVPMFQPDEPHVQNTENGSWNPAAPNQSGLSSNFSDNYISNNIEVVTQTFTATILNVSSVNTSTDTLTMSSGHGFNTGDGPINLRTTGTLPGATPALSTTAPYWIIRTGTSTLKIASTQANALAGVAIDITSSGSGTHSISFFTTAAHGYQLNDSVQPWSTGTLPAGLSTGTSYWVIKVNNDRFRLATSAANAAAGTGINITSTGSGTHRVPKIYTSTDTIYFSGANLRSGEVLANGNGPVRVLSTGAIPGGLGASTDYYFTSVNNGAGTIKLATSRANAILGLAVDLTASGYGTTYTAETNGGTSLADQATRQKTWEKYVGKTFTGTAGPRRACAMQTVLPLTNDKQAILDKINALNPSGNTHIPLGAAWGWRLLSPTPPFTEAVSYSAPLWIKAMVLMTDGMNTMPSQSSTLNGSRYTAYGYAAQARMGAGIDTASEMVAEMDAGLLRVCSNMKALGIRIYTIAYDIDAAEESVKDLLEDCATDPSLFFDATDSAAIDAAFTAIAQDLSSLRLSK